MGFVDLDFTEDLAVAFQATKAAVKSPPPKKQESTIKTPTDSMRQSSAVSPCLGKPAQELVDKLSWEELLSYRWLVTPGQGRTCPWCKDLGVICSNLADPRYHNRFCTLRRTLNKLFPS